MAEPRRGLRKTTVAAMVLLPVVIAIVIYNSFQVSEFQCTVCLEFDGRAACRTVTGQTEAEGLQSATTNACALLTSGMTDSIRCGRTPPKKAECIRLAGGVPDRQKMGVF
ncbi:MAG: hypothetical protein HY699_09665 [Deltaproteobacteria bacterium]|nr:hypothetical protein [Deltaproteobacteria bacterium]